MNSYRRAEICKLHNKETYYKDLNPTNSNAEHIATWQNWNFIIKSYFEPECHNNDVRMSAMVSQITGAIVCPTVCPGRDQRKYQNSALLASVREIHLWPVYSPYQVPVTRIMFPFNDVFISDLNERYGILTIEFGTGLDLDPCLTDIVKPAITKSFRSSTIKLKIWGILSRQIC